MAIQEEVIELARRMPGPPGELLPPGLPDREIDGFIERTGLTVPPELREWLRITNGPCIGSGGVFGIRPARINLDIEGTFQFLPQFRANKWLPVATDGCGNYYVLAAESEAAHIQPVYFVDPNQDGGYGIPTYAVASGFWQFLRFLFRKELGDAAWPFDARKVLKADPLLATIKGAPLPWRE